MGLQMTKFRRNKTGKSTVWSKEKITSREETARI